MAPQQRWRAAERSAGLCGSRGAQRWLRWRRARQFRANARVQASRKEDRDGHYYRCDRRHDV